MGVGRRIGSTGLTGHLPTFLSSIRSDFPDLRYLDLSHSKFWVGTEEKWDLRVDQLVYLNLSGTDLNRSLVTSAALHSPMLLDLTDTKLLCPLPQFPQSATVTLDSPLPCELDTELLQVEGFSSIGALALSTAVFGLVYCLCRDGLSWFLKWGRRGGQVAVRFLKVASLVSMIRFFAVAVPNARQLELPAVCSPLNSRPLFQLFMSWRFIDSNTSKEVPPVSETNLTFCSYNAEVLAANYLPSLVHQNVDAFQKLCNQRVSGCRAVLNATGGWSCWSCEPSLTLPDLPVLHCTPPTLLALTYTLPGLIVVKEVAKVLMLVAAVCCSKGKRAG